MQLRLYVCSSEKHVLYSDHTAIYPQSSCSLICRKTRREKNPGLATGQKMYMDVKICDLSLLSTLSCLLLLFPSSTLKVVWLLRVSTPLSKPQEPQQLAEFARTLVLVPDLAPYQISGDETLRANWAAPMTNFYSHLPLLSSLLPYLLLRTNSPH